MKNSLNPSLETVVALKNTYPIRKSKAQKEKFREEFALPYIRQLGYEPKIEENKSTKNVVFGCDPDKAKYTVTAHYDTPATIGLMDNLLTPINAGTFIGWQVLLAGLMLLLPVLLAILIAPIADYVCLRATGNVDLAIEVGAISAGLSIIVGFFAVYFMMVMGIPNKNNANDNTSGVATVLEIARTLPEELKNDVCFVLFDNEEKGLLGSALYAKTHKQAAQQTINFNLDCVGEGDHLLLIPSAGFTAKKNVAKLEWIGSAALYGNSNKTIHAVTRGFRTFPSDNIHFFNGIGICATTKTRFGYIATKLHTKKDTVLDTTNIALLRDVLIALMGEDKGQHIAVPLTLVEKIKSSMGKIVFILVMLISFLIGMNGGKKLAEEGNVTEPTSITETTQAHQETP